MKVFQTDKMRGLGGGMERATIGNGSASGWLSDDPWEWTRGTKAPGWCVRSVKFNSGEGARLGKEVMAFTEHTSLVHVVDARTFETHDIIRVPTIHRPPHRPRPRLSSAPSRVVSASTSLPTPASSTSSTSGAQQRRLQRNLVRRMLPVSNARRTTPFSTAPQPSLSSPSRRSTSTSGNARPSRPASSTGAEPGPIASSSTTPRPGVVQAINDAFRIPASAYSAPASIGDSTWRTLAGGDRSPVSRAVSPTSPIPPPSIPTTRLVRSGGLSAPMPSLQEWAAYVLDREDVPHHDETIRDLREDMQDDLREDEGALARRIRREERALGGMRFGTGVLFEDDGDSSSSEADLPIPRAPSDPTAVEYLRAWQEVTGLRLEDEDRREQDQDGIVVVPDLGDREVESEVHALLAVHGIPSRLGGHNHSRGHEDDVDLDEGFDDDYDPGRETDRDTNTGSTHGDYEYPLYGRRSSRAARRMLQHQLRSSEDFTFDETEEDAEGMDVDGELMHIDGGRDQDEDGEGEEETECLSNANSRSVSPSLVAGSSASGSTNVRHPSPGPSSIRYGSSSRSNLGREYLPKEDDYDAVFDEAESGGAYYSGSPSQRNGTGSTPNYVYYDDLDIAGLCFDPWGEKMYVAGVGTNLTAGSLSGGGGLFAGAFGSGSPVAGIENVGAVVEWGIRGAEKRWYVDEGWM